MLSRSALSLARRTAVRSMSSETSAASSNKVKLNFSVPHESIYNGVGVHSVIIPGSAGEYGVTANHVPYVAQLKPGVLQILHEENSGEPEKYFVAGGYALTHEDSSTVSFLNFNYC
jgi:F-type H+-transporting ATPase subunit delta